VKIAAQAIRDLLLRIAGWFGVEGAFLLLGASCLSVWAYLVINPAAPWAVVGILAVVAWLALTLRRP